MFVSYTNKRPPFFNIASLGPAARCRQVIFFGPEGARNITPPPKLRLPFVFANEVHDKPHDRGDQISRRHHNGQYRQIGQIVPAAVILPRVVQKRKRPRRVNRAGPPKPFERRPYRKQQQYDPNRRVRRRRHQDPSRFRFSPIHMPEPLHASKQIMTDPNSILHHAVLSKTIQ